MNGYTAVVLGDAGITSDLVSHLLAMHEYDVLDLTDDAALQPLLAVLVEPCDDDWVLAGALDARVVLLVADAEAVDLVVAVARGADAILDTAAGTSDVLDCVRIVA